MHDGKIPWTYLDKHLKDILEPLEVTIDGFIRICDRFTNRKLFKVDAESHLIKDAYGNLTKLKYAEDEQVD
jgi:hypothetical protein